MKENFAYQHEAPTVPAPTYAEKQKAINQFNRLVSNGDVRMAIYLLPIAM